ncbi:transposase, partial [Streptomyces hydrogenans]
TPGKGGFMINRRTYQPVAQDAGHYREILLRGGSKLPGRGGQWECRFNPYRPERVWLYDHTTDTWVTCDFRLRHLLTDPWTADMWREHAEQHLVSGDSKQDEEAIALSLAQHDRRRRSSKPPPKRTGKEPIFQGLELETEEPSRDPYAELEEFDLSTLRPYPAQPISPWSPPAADALPALPAGAGGAEASQGGQDPHPLAALFPDDEGDDFTDGALVEDPDDVYEVVEAELVDDVDANGDVGGESEGGVWDA